MDRDGAGDNLAVTGLGSRIVSFQSEKMPSHDECGCRRRWANLIEFMWRSAKRLDDQGKTADCGIRQRTHHGSVRMDAEMTQNGT